MTRADQELLGLSEVADLLGTSRQAVGNWRQRRKDFPAPLADLRSGPIWSRASVIDWARKEGIEVGPVGDVSEPIGGQQRAGTAVALMNMKGGVGKSTLTANLGWYCAYKKDWRVLLVDLDPQFNLSQYVLGTKGYEQHVEDDKKTVRDILERGPGKRNGNSDLDPSDVISEIQRWDDESGVDLIPSSLGLSFTLRNPTGKELLLSNFIDQVRSEYDLVLIDCAPTDSILTTAAYAAADSILIPVKPEFLSTIGLPLLVSSLEDFEGVYKKSVDVLGIVFNAATEKLEHDRSRAFVREVARKEKWHVFKNEVSYSDSYPKGSRLGKPIFLTDYARSWKVADFNRVGNEFYTRVTA
jgi:chromosome partitioning protein